MSMLPILEFPDPRLRTKPPTLTRRNWPHRRSKPCSTTCLKPCTKPRNRRTANQVDRAQALVIDVTEDKSRPLVFINPRISARAGEQVYQEGCLSVPVMRT